MIWTKEDILTELYKITSTSVIMQEGGITGDVWKETIPTDAPGDNCVIFLLTGDTTKFLQYGNAMFKIYFTDIFQSNSYFKDSVKADKYERLLIELSKVLFASNNISFMEYSRRLNVDKVDIETVHEHYVILSIDYQITNN